MLCSLKKADSHLLRTRSQNGQSSSWTRSMKECVLACERERERVSEWENAWVRAFRSKKKPTWWDLLPFKDSVGQVSNVTHILELICSVASCTQTLFTNLVYELWERKKKIFNSLQCPFNQGFGECSRPAGDVNGYDCCRRRFHM